MLPYLKTLASIQIPLHHHYVANIAFLENVKCQLCRMYRFDCANGTPNFFHISQCERSSRSCTLKKLSIYYRKNKKQKTKQATLLWSNICDVYPNRRWWEKLKSVWYRLTEQPMRTHISHSEKQLVSRWLQSCDLCQQIATVQTAVSHFCLFERSLMLATKAKQNNTNCATKHVAQQFLSSIYWSDYLAAPHLTK